MVQTLANRMTTNPNQPFAVCSPLSVRYEDLNRQTMTEVSGGGHPALPIFFEILGGVTAVVLTHPQQVSKAADWYVDRISEGIDTCESFMVECLVEMSNPNNWYRAEKNIPHQSILY